MGSSTSEKSSEKALMNSPLSLNPGNQISIIKLTENNYLAWRFQVLNVIQGHGLEEHIDEDSKILEKFMSVEESDKVISKNYSVQNDSSVASVNLGTFPSVSKQENPSRNNQSFNGRGIGRGRHCGKIGHTAPRCLFRFDKTFNVPINNQAQPLLHPFLQVRKM